MKTNQEIADLCLNLLVNESEWIGRYAGYADALIKRRASYEQKRGMFRVRRPLTVYTSVSKAKTGYGYDLRYKGQSVGQIRVKNGEVLLTAKPQPKGESGKYYFDWDKELINVSWTSSEATEFRKHFYSLSGAEKSKSSEHNIENHMLLELSKTLRLQKKLLCNIQPVKLLGCFFQMPTPFSASDHKNGPTYAFNKKGKPTSGGGIDILARVKHPASGSRLCVCELKDENNPSEPEEDVIQQAITYATFIGKLLKTKEAKNSEWWDLFGFSGEIPKHIDIDVVTVMPPISTENNTARSEEVVTLQDIDVALHIHTIYFNADKNTGEIISISGTLKDIIDPICK